VAYGWCIRRGVHIAVVLALQLVLGATLQVCFTTLSTLVMDLDPTSTATTQAVSNVIRCLLAAGGLAALDPLLDRIGAGITFTLAASLVASCGGLFLLQIWKGPKWRATRSQNSSSNMI
jgi:hypothetical protein